MTSSAYDAITLQQLIESNNNALGQQLSKMVHSAKNPEAIANTAFNKLRLDSRHVADNDAFILLKSQTQQGQDPQKIHDYLLQAGKRAALIFSEINPVALFDNTDILPCPVLYVPDIRHFLGSLIQARLQYQQLITLPTVVAVTGTNGKTTISQLVAQLAQLAGHDSAVMGTAGNGKLDALLQARHTTGDALAVQQFLYHMGEQNVDLLALEASSHGLDQKRLQGVPIKVAIYTNLSRDHLDYHADMAEYVAAKAKLFDKAHFPTLTHAIINIDDEHANVMLDTAKASNLTVWTYSLQADNEAKGANFVATKIEPSLQGVKITLRSVLGDSQGNDVNNINIISPLLGHFNVANLLAAIAAAVALGISLEHIASLVPQLKGAVGRMQRVPSTDGCFIVDYAHTPDALTQVLDSLRTHCQGQLWAVFGCGGDRDAGKRPLMAQAGLSGADQVILTADNPRTEDPNVILQNMQAGMSEEQYQRTHIEPARQRAIEYAVSHASANDIVVIAGKGHETYQEINGVRHDFDDSVILQQALQQAGRI
ncbi:UDP-N-acetylmuramoyl-L-alanyl-D-glutamate--2,6-diaminopimelate ligase [Psychrobacter sp. Cmf 22.2]|uniref:UDP-N-acetylmuramoyl-L-alanyl-D-glutamate--2, 6-diaminopimelate ligase n=1 Tax=Psychrobacter sp. Cmf 22.2 TaxID=1926478 RepID=UPI0009470CE9|nr:UDP-N-acetylmuramoyl-L-alanyl-D-glutamate--2,6-diaminopimelate ligase [Psychrobacter sp. Cmf 22.2]OLF36762.1 UDP-N-acetylmuramoyl-L-alanyl-D-glutamate--2,6-diaminopimelate ligase [Psychrobacter sp. Cmf 22.2]